MGKLLFFIFLLPLSWLPLGLLYRIAYLIYFLLYRIFGYRKEVVRQNINASFPELEKEAKRQITKDFYKHFADIVVEGIKNLSISKYSLEKRYKIRNPELVNRYYEAGKSIILCAGHINNWEWWITYQNEAIKHKAIGIGMPLTQASLGEEINKSRARLGMTITDSGNYKEEIEKSENNPFALLVLGDQSPGSVKKSYWTHFLNQPTAFTFGTEMIANSYNLPVIYYTVHKVKRGYYELEFKLLCSEPLSLPYGEITEKYVHFLEKDILNEPSQWIWSHKRWKKSVPNDLNSIKNEHKKHFNARFRNI
jgi:KDO2-lipid IV(A) lauroyltransferase